MKIGASEHLSGFAKLFTRKRKNTNKVACKAIHSPKQNKAACKAIYHQKTKGKPRSLKSKSKVRDMVIISGSFHVCLWAFVLLVASSIATTSEAAAVKPSRFAMPFNRTLFPPDFIFGAGSSAYQVYIYRESVYFKLLPWTCTHIIYPYIKNKITLLI